MVQSSKYYACLNRTNKEFVPSPYSSSNPRYFYSSLFKTIQIFESILRANKNCSIIEISDEKSRFISNEEAWLFMLRMYKRKPKGD